MAEDAASARASLARRAATIVPLAAWRALRDEAAAAAAAASVGGVGVLLEPADDPAALDADLARLALVAIRFPSFTDGRGYSAARTLRERQGWRGPLMAVGDVLRDQLLLLERCGFDTFWLRADEDLDDALTAFADFSEHYQACAGRAPLFERRAAPEALR